MSDLFSLLAAQPGTTLHQGADDEALAMAEKALGFAFPSDLKSILLRTNGAEVFNGYFRLFGVGSSDCINSLQWNREDHWKFAWKGRIDTGFESRLGTSTPDFRPTVKAKSHLSAFCLTMMPRFHLTTLSRNLSPGPSSNGNLDWWDSSNERFILKWHGRNILVSVTGVPSAWGISICVRNVNRSSAR